MTAEPPGLLRAKILTVSDGVVGGVREDGSGQAVADALTAGGWQLMERRAVADGIESVAGALRQLTAGFAGVVVTTGGTGFSPRDQTPEGTDAVLERRAPGLAEAMRAVNPGPGRLSRAVAGTVGTCIVINTPGSPSGAAECLGAVLDALPHALALLVGAPTRH